MEITDIKVRKMTDEGKMKAIVSVTLDNMLVIHDIKVIEGQEKTFIAMPSRRNAEGEYKDIVHPINGEMREKLQNAILAKYYEALKEQENAL
ncbi:MAG: septation regulator SpoVG [Clostridia bacterium]|nr:septation regulator SpoVG [Clostridia bacterium]